ncbi:MAG: TrkH family potassium uptake protein [Myxococcota bacterium]
MNVRRVLSILGLVLYALAGAELVPLLVCIFPLDLATARGFLAGAGVAALLGVGFRKLGESEGDLYRRDGVMIVVGAWLLASVTGAVPYLASGAVPGVVDALFESASGFTTTGASILTDIEALPSAVLFWRSMTQWLGGIGIVVLFVALLSELGPGARFLFNLEVPGPRSEIFHARVRQTAAALFRIYLALTVAQIAIMLVLGAGVYDAVVHSFSTISTGGFSPYNDSLAHFPIRIQLVVLVFMLAAGVNFFVHYSLASKRNLSVLRDLELRVYLGIAAMGTLLVLWNLMGAGAEGGVAHLLVDAAFQVVSVLTTTGFATSDFETWPGLSRALLVALMFGGGCAGSTAGGAKIVRLLIGWRVAMREVRLTFSPNAVVAIVVGGKPVPEESVRSVAALLLLWLVGWGVGAVLLSVGGAGIVTAATASMATLSNIGPGLSAVGPTGNFAFFADWQKLVMVGLMWLGRLEFFAVLALFQTRFWRR